MTHFLGRINCQYRSVCPIDECINPKTVSWGTENVDFKNDVIMLFDVFFKEHYFNKIPEYLKKDIFKCSKRHFGRIVTNKSYLYLCSVWNPIFGIWQHASSASIKSILQIYSFST